MAAGGGRAPPPQRYVLVPPLPLFVRSRTEIAEGHLHVHTYTHTHIHTCTRVYRRAHTHLHCPPRTHFHTSSTAGHPRKKRSRACTHPHPCIHAYNHSYTPAHVNIYAPVLTYTAAQRTHSHAQRQAIPGRSGHGGTWVSARDRNRTKSCRKSSGQCDPSTLYVQLPPWVVSLFSMSMWHLCQDLRMFGVHLYFV